VRTEDLTALGVTPAPAEPEPALPVAAAAPVPAPAEQGVLLQLGNMSIGMPTSIESVQPQAVEGDDDIPLSNQPPVSLTTPNNSVNVQTTNQPVLVVPLSMNRNPAPTELIQPPAPGAPSTLAVDTSPNALSGIAPPRSNTPNRNKRSSSPGAAAPSVVNVNKVGGGGMPSAAQAANVRVSVNKLG
jgi:hypothetical protein